MTGLTGGEGILSAAKVAGLAATVKTGTLPGWKFEGGADTRAGGRLAGAAGTSLS